MVKRLLIIIKNSAGLFIVFFTISLLFIIVISSVISLKQSLEDNNNFFSDNASYINFNIPDTVDKNKIISALTKEKGIMLLMSSYFKTQQDSKQIIKALYFNEKPYYIPEMMKGRFFDKDDFKDNDNIAVIGKNFIDKIMEIDGQKYIVFNGKEYRIIDSDFSIHRFTI